MIPRSLTTGRPTRVQGSDCCMVRCNVCGQGTYVSASAVTEEEIRAVAAKSGWSTELHGKQIYDICPEHHQLKEES